MDAADQAHDRRRVPRLPPRRLLQSRRRHDRPGDPARRHDDRGRRHPVPLRPRPRAPERPLRHGRRRQAPRGLPSEARRVHRAAGEPGTRRGHRPARPDRGRRHAQRDRRRHVRHHQAPRRQGQGPRRSRQAGRWLLQPCHRDPGREPAVTAPTIVRPYGDTTGDGMVQVSFTLPIAHDKRAEGAALQLAAKMGLEPAMLVHAKAMGPDFTFFVVYGSATHLVDLTAVQVVEREYPLLSAKEVNSAIKQRLARPLVVVGACIGTDAHTVGIDAILNVKGFAGEKGLEYYGEITVVNMGAQVLVPELVARARAEKADAILVSQVVTQKDAHLHNTRELASAVRAASWPKPGRPLLVVGGPRFDVTAAAALGVDRVFGRGTTPGEVASYLAYALRSGWDR